VPDAQSDNNNMLKFAGIIAAVEYFVEGNHPKVSDGSWSTSLHVKDKEALPSHNPLQQNHRPKPHQQHPPSDEYVT